MKHRANAVESIWSEQGEAGPDQYFAPSCYQCGATQTPQWREGPMGPKTLCNACGVKCYRLTMHSKKMVAGTRASKVRRLHVPLFKRFPVVAGDSGDETCIHSAAMSDNSEESEEHVAALSLLSFSGVQPSQGLLDQTHRHVSFIIEALDIGEATIPGGLAKAASSLPISDLLLLKEMQADVQQTYRELQAADAATTAVAQFLREKKEQAALARERARAASQLFLEEIRQLESQYHLSKALSLVERSGSGSEHHAAS